jgi:hypothetical protein
MLFYLWCGNPSVLDHSRDGARQIRQGAWSGEGCRKDEDLNWPWEMDQMGSGHRGQLQATPPMGLFCSELWPSSDQGKSRVNSSDGLRPVLWCLGSQAWLWVVHGFVFNICARAWLWPNELAPPGPSFCNHQASLICWANLMTPISKMKLRSRERLPLPHVHIMWIQVESSCPWPFFTMVYSTEETSVSYHNIPSTVLWLGPSSSPATDPEDCGCVT